MKFTTLLAGLCLAATAITTAPTCANASTVLIDQGTTTFDPTTGLDWLDLTTTLNLQPSEILAGVGGYVEAGWHYATVDEVNGLFVDAGLPTLSLASSSPAIWKSITYSAAPNSAILALINLLGNTGGSGGSFRNFAYGMLQGNTDGLLYFGELGIYDTSTPEGNIGNLAEIFQANLPSIPGLTYPLSTTAGVRSRVTGNFLIRDHVEVVTPPAVTPLPAALPMFAAATGVMGLMGWRRRRSSGEP